jgi:transcriptional regulator with XRE-family HTH domain
MFTYKTKDFIISQIKAHYNFKSDAEFARFLGIKPQVLSNWRNRNTIDYELLARACTEIDANWLMTGTGSMLKNKQAAITVVNEEPVLYAKTDQFAAIDALKQTILTQQETIATLKKLLELKSKDFAAGQKDEK